MLEILMVPVASSNLAAVGYDPETLTLQIAFHDGSVYIYYDVSPAVYAGLLLAKSKGRYFRALIRDSYDYERVS